MSALNKPGRPRIYQHVIDGIKPEHGWVTLTEKQKTRTAPSAYRNRYPGYDFRAIPNGSGGFTLQARIAP